MLQLKSEINVTRTAEAVVLHFKAIFGGGELKCEYLKN